VVRGLWFQQADFFARRAGPVFEPILRSGVEMCGVVLAVQRTRCVTSGLRGRRQLTSALSILPTHTYKMFFRVLQYACPA
jgi:hypothetical protein